MNTAEAAAELGISDRRVRALIVAGKLKARETVRGYDVDPTSVEAYKSLERKAGRPRRS